MSSTVAQKPLPRHAILHDEHEFEWAAQSTRSGVYDLDPSEVQWRDRQPTLEKCGYALRKRYKPGWKPSWVGTNLNPMYCEDSVILAKPHVIDARRLKDDELVAIKRCNKNSREVQIAQYLSTLHDPRNHSVAVLETFPDPLDPQLTLMVMPFLRPCNDPEFRNIGEVIDFIDQTLEGLSFLHELNIAHRDVAAVNIMMDGRPLYPQGYHPIQQDFSPDALHEVTPLSRTEHPVRYFFIDFDLSVRFAEGDSHLVIGDVGRDDKVPELSNDVPYDAFKVDIFALGNLYYKEFHLKYHSMDFLLPMIDRMKQQQPDARPTIDEVAVQWQTIRQAKSSSASWRLSPKSETVYERAFNDTVAAALGGLKSLRSYVR